MDGVATPAKPKINRWLPYWAVVQADMQQTRQSWVYRIWVLVSVLSAVGCVLYRFGLAHEAGIVQPASRLIADLLRWTLLGSVSLVVVLSAGSISAERGTMADSVLSRGISRHQYFLGKWHSRLATVLSTFWVLSGGVLVAALFLLHEDVSILGSLVAIGTISALLAAVISCGVTVSALCNTTVLGIALLWVLLYGGGFALSLLPAHYPSPARLLATLPYMVKGYYDSEMVMHLVAGALGLSLATAIVGLVHFARRDI
jgi:hypothetical protein